MLEGCHAYVIGKDEEHDLGLQRMATKLGFSSASRLFHKGVPRIDSTRTTLSFFLVHSRLEDAIMRSVIERVRSSDSDLIRFAPLVMFLDDGPYELVLRYVRLGFDDVITVPERLELVVSRLSGQLGQEVIYFQTSTYLGPDRRRMELTSAPADERRSGHHAHIRYAIVRSAGQGVRILRLETYGQDSDLGRPFSATASAGPVQAAGLRH